MGADTGRSIEDMWKAIVEIHNESKALFLLCEEIEPRQFRTFIQPYNELRHAYEHAVRCQANQLGLDGKKPDCDYQRTSMGKTLGHEYRGFFDVADWLAVILREAILETLRPYSPSCITASLIDYYSHDRARIVEISEDIAKIRGGKDIARKIDSEGEVAVKDPSVVEEVRKYKAILSELQAIHKKVLRAIPALEEHTQKTKRDEEERARKARREDRRKWIWGIVASLLTATIIAVAGIIWHLMTSKIAPASANPAPAAVSPAGAGATPTGAASPSP